MALVGRTYIIAEAGTSHEGNVREAFQLVRQAAQAGADAVKFQLYKDASFLRPEEQDKAKWFEARRLEPDEWRRVAASAVDYHIDFMASAFDKESVDFLVEMGVKRFKVASRTLRDDTELVEYIVSIGKMTLISLGMVDRLPPSLRQNPTVIPLHCVSLYPCPPELATLDSIAGGIGYSDHTQGWLACVLAVARGAPVVEKHFRLEPGHYSHPDWRHSLNPTGFKFMVDMIRETEVMLGYKEPALA